MPPRREPRRPEQPFEDLPEALRFLRLRRRMTQGDLAAAARISKQRIGDFERGAARPRLGVLERIMAALRVDLLALTRALESVRHRRTEIRGRRCRRNGRPPKPADAARSIQAFERFLHHLAADVALVAEAHGDE